MRKKYKIKKSDTVLLNIGRMDKQKNQSFLIDVFTEYHNINKSSKLIIIGDGIEKQNLEDKIMRNNLGTNVLLLPPQNDTSSFYSLADVFVMTSLFEGMPVVSIEAQANGLKCIFSNAITRESNHSGDADFLPLDAGPQKWANKIADLGLSHTPSEYGRIKKYDIKSIAHEINEIYFSLS